MSLRIPCCRSASVSWRLEGHLSCPDWLSGPALSKSQPAIHFVNFGLQLWLRLKAQRLWGYARSHCSDCGFAGYGTGLLAENDEASGAQSLLFESLASAARQIESKFTEGTLTTANAELGYFIAVAQLMICSALVAFIRATRPRKDY